MRTRSNFEKRVADELAYKGVSCYLPCLHEVRQWKDRRKEIRRPLFAGYVFARFADSGAMRIHVLSASGAVRILGRGSQIEAIPDAEIDSVRAMLAANVRCYAHPFLREGSRVRVRRGPLRGLEGLLIRFKNDARLVVSVGLLSQAVAAEIDIGDVEYAGQNPAVGKTVA